MLFSRLWMALLAVVACLALGTASLMRQTYLHDRASDTGALVANDRRVLEQLLRREARTRLDDLTPVSANPELVTLMSAIHTRANDSATTIGQGITARLRALNTELGPLRGDILFAVDPRGIVVGRAGLGEGDVGQFLGGHALIASALAGNTRDDVWEISGNAYRMAARPVISQGRYYVGAIVHGMIINRAFAETISRAVPGASLLFFGGDGVYAGVTPAPEAGLPVPPPSELLAEIARTARERDDWRARGATEAVPLPDDRGVAVFGALPGLAGASGAGFALARGVPTIASNFLFKAKGEELARVPWGIFGGLAALAVLLGLGIGWLEYDSKKRSLAAALKALTKPGTDRLDPLALSGFARELAVTANEGLDEVVKREVTRAGGRLRNSSELESLLSMPTPEPRMTGVPANVKRAMSADDEQRHWREVHAQFGEKRRACSEPEVSWEVFTQTLQRSKDQLMNRVACRGVTFTATVKDGRATLRAAPLR
ncbi:MAG: MXAN_5187 C-terminal domain-containing protein [Polyangiales bacterium]